MRPIDADALIEKCGGWYVDECTESGFIGTLENILATEPTIQPQSTTGQLNDGARSTNLIDRQEAIDRFNVIRPVDPKKDEYTKGIDVGIAMCIVAVKDQPTIQPVATDTNVGDKISRQQAIELIKNYCENGCDIAEDNWCPSCQREQFIKLLKALPTVPPEPQEGHWINGKCDLCGEHAPFWAMASTYHESKYCPNCGAKMRGEQHETD